MQNILKARRKLAGYTFVFMLPLVMLATVVLIPSLSIYMFLMSAM